MDNRFGGSDLASTGKFEFRTKADPRFKDRRMQLLLRSLKANLHKFDIHQLSIVLYSTVKLRLPDNQLIGEAINIITDKMQKGSFS